MYKKLLLICLMIGLGCMIGFGLSVPEHVTTGPYNFSFDMGLPKGEHEIEIKEPLYSEDLGGEKSVIYRVSITNKTALGKTVTFGLTEYEGGLPMVDGDKMATVIESIMESQRISDITTAKRSIDGVDGAAGSGEEYLLGVIFNIYYAAYQPPFGNGSLVKIISTYPWDEGTLSLLKTLHVERINATN